MKIILRDHFMIKRDSIQKLGFKVINLAFVCEYDDKKLKNGALTMMWRRLKSLRTLVESTRSSKDIIPGVSLEE